MNPISPSNTGFAPHTLPISTNLNTEQEDAESTHADQSNSNRSSSPNDLSSTRENILAINYLTQGASQIKEPQQARLESGNSPKLFDVDEFDSHLSVLANKYNKKVGDISELTEEVSDMEKFAYLKQGREAREFLEERCEAGGDSLNTAYLIQELLDYSSAPGVCREMRKNARSAYASENYQQAKEITAKYSEVIPLLCANKFGSENFFVLYRGQMSHSHLEEGKVFVDAAPMSFSISKDKALSFALWDDEDATSIGDEEDMTSVGDEEDMVSVGDEEDMASIEDGEDATSELPSLMYVVNAQCANISHFNEQLEDEEVSIVAGVSIAMDSVIEAQATVEAIRAQAAAQDIKDIEAKIANDEVELSIIKQYFDIGKASDSSHPDLIAEFAAARNAARIATLDAEAKASDPRTLDILNDSELEALSMPGHKYRIVYKGLEEFENPKNKIKGIYHVIAERIE